MGFLSGIKRAILDLKIYWTIHHSYPNSLKLKRCKSIVPSRIKNIGNDIVIEEDVDFGPFLDYIPDGLYVGKGTLISYCNSIGKYTSISYGVKIGLAAHPLDFISTSPVFYSKRRGWLTTSTFKEETKGFVTIGHDVLISANAVVLAGIKIGNGAVIGAGAIVNRDVPPYAVVGGVPGKILKYRFPDELIALLEETKFWDLPKNQLLKYEKYFNNPVEFIKALKEPTT